MALDRVPTRLQMSLGRDSLQSAKFIVSHGIIKGKGLQFPGTNFVDKTLKPPESTYKTTFVVLSIIWYRFVPGLGALSP